MATITAKERFQENVREAVATKLAEALFLDVPNVAASIYDCVHTTNEQRRITLAVRTGKRHLRTDTESLQEVKRPSSQVVGCGAGLL